MNCIRCELAAAKLWAILYHNTRRSAADLVNKLNESQRGVYYLAFDDDGATVFRKNDNAKAPAIVIWKMNVT